MNNTYRILLVAESTSAKFGGESALALHYYRVLRARGMQVWLVTHERTRAELVALFPDDDDFLFFVKDTKWHRFLWRIGAKFPDRVANFSFGFLLRLLSQLVQRKLVRRLVQEKGITVIHQPMPVSPKEPSLIYDLGAPVVIGPMNGGMDYPSAFKAMQTRSVFISLWLARRAANVMNVLLPGKRKAALLLVANERTKQALPSCLKGVKTEILVENGVDLSVWKNANHAQNLSTTSVTHYVFLGRLVDWKAVDLMLIAFAQAARHAPMSMSIVGDGVERQNLEKLAVDLGLMGATRQAGKVHFFGWLTQESCAAVLQDSDALVLPSLMECGGAVVLEAMAMSMPVVASNWGGPTDYLDNTCGILVDPISRESFVDGLSKALQVLATQPDLRIAMGDAGRRKIVNHFDWEIKVDRILEAYKQVGGQGVPSLI
jgi:glycosyltransferase involved in cell wall biosynthesis